MGKTWTNNFPELLGNTYELSKIFFDKIPIKKPNKDQAKFFESLIPMVQAARSDLQQAPDSRLQNAANFLEQVIDVCVMELYFAQHMAEKKLGITAEVTKLLRPVKGQEKPDDLTKALLDFYAQANDSAHPIRNILLRVPLDSPDLLAVIQREGAV